mgnify:CR=1 FL=1|jgi:hypothetical protein
MRLLTDEIRDSALSGGSVGIPVGDQAKKMGGRGGVRALSEWAGMEVRPLGSGL